LFRRIFTFILGFAAPSVVPSSIIQGLLGFLSEAFVMHEDIWEALVSSIEREIRILAHSSVVAIFRNKEDEVLSRTIALSAPPTRIWGLELPGCFKSPCQASSNDVHGEVHRKHRVFHEKARFFCAKCKVQTSWIKRPDWIYDLDPPSFRVFWYDYPVHQEKIAALQTELSKLVVYRAIES
jgi:hypothetical protein